MRTRVRSVAMVIASSLLVSGCYGPFNLTRQLHHWNEQIGDKYINELIFLAFMPVYGVATLGDALIFNSVEFWTGRNPVLISSMRSLHSPRPVHHRPDA